MANGPVKIMGDVFKHPLTELLSAGAKIIVRKEKRFNPHRSCVRVAIFMPPCCCYALHQRDPPSHQPRGSSLLLIPQRQNLIAPPRIGKSLLAAWSFDETSGASAAI